MRSSLPAATCCLLLVSLSTSLRAADPGPLDDALRSFSEHWQEEDWIPKVGPRTRYMRPLDEQGWKSRMLALQAIVRAGDKAIEPMRDWLRDGSPTQRALAAQALGYLPAQAAREDLLKTAAADDSDVVRLYAIDSLGMLGGQGVEIDWESLGENQKNRDVKRHLAYAAERAGQPVDPKIVTQLADWDSGSMDTARVGEPAPDFTAQTVGGETVGLSDFRGRKAVVLVFVYGDT